MALALRFVEAVTPGEDQIGPLQQLLFAIQKLPRRAAERRQLVHAIERNRTRGDVACVGQRHRRVIPEDRPVDAMSGLKLVEQTLQLAVRRNGRQSFRQMGTQTYTP